MSVSLALGQLGAYPCSSALAKCEEVTQEIGTPLPWKMKAEVCLGLTLVGILAGVEVAVLCLSPSPPRTHTQGSTDIILSGAS